MKYLVKKILLVKFFIEGEDFKQATLYQTLLTLFCGFQKIRPY